MRPGKDSANHRYKALTVHLVVAALVTMAFTTATLSAANGPGPRIIEDRPPLTDAAIR